MLQTLATESTKGRLAMGSKSLAHDATWSRPAVSGIEVALLRNAAFPELGVDSGLRHEFIILDPSTRDDAPSHEDLVERIVGTAHRLHIPTVVVGNQANPRLGTGGFSHTSADLEKLSPEEFAAALSALRERFGWVLSGSRFNESRHIFLPQFDYALLAVVVELMSKLSPEARPFVHLATRQEGCAMAHSKHFGSLDRFGHAIHQLNTDRQRIFVYGWSTRIAQRLTLQMGIGVQPLDVPPELALVSEAEQLPDRFTVGYFSAPTADAGFDRIDQIVRATNSASQNGKRTRFVVQVKPQHGPDGQSSLAVAQRLKLLSIPERNVTIIDEFMPRSVYLNAIRQVDAVLIPRPPSQSPADYVSLNALHAMAAGKLVLTLDDVELAGLVKSRVIKARDPRALGEFINDIAGDLRSVRTAARVARSAHFATLRPSRLFAQLLYGPLILANASGHDVV
ncbi:MAG: hypothetical protein AAF580_12930 [Pseudomonadota bacterium]